MLGNQFVVRRVKCTLAGCSKSEGSAVVYYYIPMHSQTHQSKFSRPHEAARRDNVMMTIMPTTQPRTAIENPLIYHAALISQVDFKLFFKTIYMGFSKKLFIAHIVLVAQYRIT